MDFFETIDIACIEDVEESYRERSDSDPVVPSWKFRWRDVYEFGLFIWLVG